MNEGLVIPARTAQAIRLRKGMEIAIVDVEGKQVADFFAVRDDDSGEFLSAGATMDANASVKLKQGAVIYSNRYRPMFTVMGDDVGEHDLLHPCCRPEMYEFFYRNGRGHPNCLDNINHALKQHRMPSHPAITPINLFMHTRIDSDGGISVEEPKSKPGDKVLLMVEMDLLAVVAACSVEESRCNGGKCTCLRLHWK